jgi:hypothetical protein
VQCPACGARNRDDAAFCLTCRATITAPEAHATPGVTSAPIVDTSWGAPYYDRDTSARAAPAFARFWDRAFALILDSIFAFLLAIPPAIALGALGAWLAYERQAQPINLREQNRFDHNRTVATFALAIAAFLLATLAYQLIMTARGGGWGMRMMGIRVVRADNGEKPGYGRASGASSHAVCSASFRLWEPSRHFSTTCG